MDKYVVAFITAPTDEVAEAIANKLLDQRLAACVNIVPAIKSLYLWDGDTESDEEVLLIAKTKSTVFPDRFVPAVREVHPYDVPEIIALPIALGSQDYLDWIERELA